MRGEAKVAAHKEISDEDLKIIFQENFDQRRVELSNVEFAAMAHGEIKGKEQKIYDWLRYLIRKSREKFQETSYATDFSEHTLGSQK